MKTADLLQFLRRHPLAVEASATSVGPQAAVVGIAVTDQFEIIFDALETTRKVQNLRRNARAAFVIGGLTAGDERSAQVEGMADEPSGAELERLKQAYYSVHTDASSRCRRSVSAHADQEECTCARCGRCDGADHGRGLKPGYQRGTGGAEYAAEQRSGNHAAGARDGAVETRCRA